MILEKLGKGKNSAVTKEQLMQILRIEMPREFHSILERERLNGAVILSGSGGYYKPSDDPVVAIAELSAFIRRQHNMAESIVESTKSAEDELRRLLDDMNHDVSDVDEVDGR